MHFSSTVTAVCGDSVTNNDHLMMTMMINFNVKK